MKKKMMVVGMMALAMAGMVMAEVALKPLTTQEMGYYASTDALELEAADLTVTTDNVAQTNTVTLTGPVSWQFMGYRLDVPFDSTANTNIGSILYTVAISNIASGVGTTLVNGRQVASDVFRTYKAEFPVELSTNHLYCGTITNGNTATITVIMGAVPSSSPMSLKEFDKGRVRTFFRIWR